MKQMERIWARLVIGAALVAMVAFGADNSLGTWKLNMDKSKFNPGPAPIKSLTTTREASDGGVKVTSTGERADGTPINAGYTAKDDGNDDPVTGSPLGDMAIK